MMRDAYPDSWISTSEAADFFGVDPSTIRQWGRRYGIRPVGKIGKEAAWDRVQLMRTEKQTRAAARRCPHKIAS